MPLSEDHSYPAPVSRRTGIHLFAFLLSRIVGQHVRDPTSGFRLYNRRAIGVFARDYPHDYPEVEAVLMVHAHRLRMCEVPVRMEHQDRLDLRVVVRVVAREQRDAPAVV